ncbi:MAG: hypothetical protein J7574_15810 [Flavobacterium sp.]|uniref:hypothetical protein n=1 Tax=Flavobacterium sp. TaxID=239 RepID=UPI001B09DB00|nr:hypothetical protein [Flavobacterium sp.]MBO9585632.1 hypothetical protein [Flavobacterium sp.]
MDILIVFVSGLVPTLITLWLNERVKGSVQNTFNKQLEEIKKEHSKELSQFQSELNYLKSKESFKFTKLHEKRFEVMAETYKYLTDVLIKLRLYVAPLKSSLNDETAEEINHKQSCDYHDAHNKFHEYYSFNKIYFNDEIEELLEKYLASSLEISNQHFQKEYLGREGTFYNTKVFISDGTAYEKVRELIEPIQFEIKNKFREVLGE